MGMSAKLNTAPLPPIEVLTSAKGRVARILEPVPFVLAHLAPLGALASGATTGAWVLCAVLWFVRMFGITAGFHRYFSHRTFATSRAFQLVLAVLAQSSGQRGVLWWAAHHRAHHKHSDREGDPHSPRRRGFWHAHVGWLYDPGADDTRTSSVRDFSRFPELRFLNRFWWLPSTGLALIVFAAGGAGPLFVGFFLSTVICWHTTFLVNSVAHRFGSRPYATGDDSRNSWWVALLTHGEGWHNNHHYDMNAVRQGRRWWQLDVTWYILLGLSAVGLIWNLHASRPEPLPSGS